MQLFQFPNDLDSSLQQLHVLKSVQDVCQARTYTYDYDKDRCILLLCLSKLSLMQIHVAKLNVLIISIHKSSL
jgi:hypothetical protein